MAGVNVITELSNYNRPIFSEPYGYLDVPDWSSNLFAPEPYWIHDPLKQTTGLGLSVGLGELQVLGQTSRLTTAGSTGMLRAPGGVSLRGDVVLSGGRGGQKVKTLIGPPNSAVRGAGGNRAFVTNDKGEVILDITRKRVKPVTPGQGFGSKRTPTSSERSLLEKLLGDGS